MYRTEELKKITENSLSTLQPKMRELYERAVLAEIHYTETRNKLLQLKLNYNENQELLCKEMKQLQLKFYKKTQEKKRFKLIIMIIIIKNQFKEL